MPQLPTDSPVQLEPYASMPDEVSRLAGDPQTSYVQANMNGQNKPVDGTEAGTTNDSVSPALDKLFNFQESILSLRRILDDWNGEIAKTETNRLTRDVQINTEALRQKGQLDEDETIIPVRVIDVNIQREQPAYVNYLKNSRRLAIFNCLSQSDLNTQKLEQEFTRGMTYQAWENAYFKTIDGAQTHGWDSIEVVFNELFPLNCGVEHIGHDMLFFPQTITDLQASPEVIRAYDVTRLQLETYVKEFGFNAQQVALYFSSFKDTQRENETHRIYKRFFKSGGIVYVAWFSYSPATTDWLKAPEQAFVGVKEKQTVMVPQQRTVMQPIAAGPNGEIIQQPTTVTEQVPEEQWVNKPLTQYPIFLLPYRESEKPQLFNRKGRVFLDEAKQECQTAILSGFVNGLTRAANLYASMDKEDGTGGSLKEINNLKLAGGRVLNKKVNFFHPDYPDPMVLRALQYFDVSNSQESNQINFAVMNRDDSRKTATELDQANEQQNLLNSVNLTLFSTFLRQILSFSWMIVQSQALQEKIVLLQIEIPVPMINPLTGQPVIDPATGQPMIQGSQKQNNTEVLKQVFDVRAAGDVDVIQRDQKVQQMMADWPVISQTPLAMTFLQDLMILKYPDKGEGYAKMLEGAGQMEQMQGLIASLYTILDGSMKQNPQEFNSLPPEQQQQLAQVMQQAQQFTTANKQKPTQSK